MTSKFAIKSILGVSLIFMLGAMSSPASAIVSSTTVSGCSLYKKALGQCSVFVDGILKGLGNVTKNPTAFRVTMSKISGQVFCKNPAGNSATANGQPFFDEFVSLDAGDTIAPGEVSRNGKALSETTFHDPVIIGAFPADQFPDCQNQNWIKVIVVTRMQVMGRQYEDPTPADNSPGNCFLNPDLAAGEEFDFDGCTVVDTLRTSCRIEDPYFNNPALALGVKSYSYGNENTGTGGCTEICHSNDETQCNAGFPVHMAPSP